MFRTGGSAEGITSGLQPRQGYQGTGQAWEQFVKKIPDIREEAKKAALQKTQRKYGPDFWVDFGLNLASTPPAGNIVSTAAQAAKDPFSRYTTAKREDELTRYASEADMFKTMLGSYGDIMAAESGEGMAGKTEQWKFEQVPKLINTIAELEAIPVDERTTEQQNQLDTAKINLGRLEKEDPFVGWFLQSDQSDKLFKKVKNELLQADQAEGGEGIYTGEDDPQLWEDTYVEFRKRVKRMGKAEGGRIGYADAGAVMPGQPMQAQAAGPTDQGAAPEDMGSISYEELRARLPQEVTDDIVRLIANSAEALEDFAMIQTEQDINTFNKKYGVTLVLPSEG
jgi:hypothetical protein